MSLPATNQPGKRSGRFGSADIAALLGLEDAFGSPYSVWYAKTHELEIEETDAMRWGRLLEPLLVEEYQRHDAGGMVIGTQCHHTFKPWPVASATLDAVAIAGSDPVAVETKTTRDYKWDEVPAPYQAQVQWQMGIAGLKEAHVAVLFKPVTRFEVFSVPFDEDVFGRMIELARKFWTDHVLTGIPPEADGHPATTEALARWEAMDEVVDISHLAGSLRERGQIVQSIKALENRKAEIDNRIKAALGSAITGVIDGKPAVKWSKRTSSRFDQKAFREKHPRVAARYQVTNEYRAMTVRKEFTGIEGGDE